MADIIIALYSQNVTRSLKPANTPYINQNDCIKRHETSNIINYKKYIQINNR